MRLRFSPIPIWVFLASTLGIVVVSWLFYRHERTSALRVATRELETIADLKVTQIADWCRQRLADAVVIGAPTNCHRVDSYLAGGDPESTGYLLALMESLRGTGRYFAVLLVDPRGTIRLRAGLTEPDLTSEDRKHVDLAMRSGRPVLGDLHCAPVTGRIHMGLYVPLVLKGASSAAFVLEIDPESFLYQLIRSWPVPTQTGETLLVRRQGKEVLFLTDLRHRKGTALRLRLPFSLASLPATMAALGQVGTVQGIDYRGIAVHAVIRAVPGTGWKLLAKQDEAEIFGPFHSEGLILGSLSLASILVVGLGVLLVGKRREAGFFRRQYELEQESSRALLALHRGEEQIRLLLDSTAEAILGLDLEGRCTLANPSSLRLLGYRDASELLGKDLHQRIHHTRPDGRPLPVEECRIHRAFHSEDRIHADDEILFRADGSSFPVEYWSCPQYRDGVVTGRVVTFLDITLRQRAEAEIRQRNEELEASNQDLADFAHTVAHDLRDPLGTIIGHAVFLTEPDQTPQVQQRSAGAILRIGRRMENIIQELLLLAQVRRTAPPRDVVRMAEIVAAAQDRLIDAITTSAAEIVTPPGWPPALGYGPWIEEVWVNYLSNAMKYGGRPPRIELGATVSDGRVHFWVKDDGAGIPPDQQERLFKPFVRLQIAGPRGHGLGLSIVRRIMDKLGGEVSLESVPGQGSTFGFTLPGPGSTAAS